MRITIVGGGGHVGLPLSIALAVANKNDSINIYDTNHGAVDKINKGEMPFNDSGAAEKLKKVIQRNLKASTHIDSLEKADVILIVFSTPIDQNKNPNLSAFEDFINMATPHLTNGQVIILRSTLYPGTSKRVQNMLRERGLDIEVAYCPERIAQGEALNELHSLPQIISACGNKALITSKKIFSQLTKEIITLEPLEAEMAKLFTNSWRYLQFAIANQFYMLAESNGIDFNRLYQAITYEYPRAQDFAKAGFTAGPCLYRDTIQLAAFSGQSPFLGNAALEINEGLPDFLVHQIEKEYNLAEKTVGILGMAFKAESDDKRLSLSYRLKKILAEKAKDVLCTDEYIKEDSMLSLEEVLQRADLLILATPHKKYSTIKTNVPLVDVWGHLKEKHL